MRNIKGTKQKRLKLMIQNAIIEKILINTNKSPSAASTPLFIGHKYSLLTWVCGRHSVDSGSQRFGCPNCSMQRY